MKQKLFLSLFVMLTATMVWADVEINATNFPDENFRNWLLSQEYGADGVLQKKEISIIKKMNVSNLGIQSLKGIEYFTALTELECNSNKLTELDVSKNKKLDLLDCSNNQLTALDVSKNMRLWILVCYQNKIKGSAMGELVKSLHRFGDIPKTIYTGKDFDKAIKMNMNSFRVINNENEQNEITATQVADAKSKGWLPRANNGMIWYEYAGNDAKKREGLKINEENFPDRHFRNWILSQKYGGDSVLTKTEIKGISFVKIPKKNIQSLKGIEYFTALTSLFCENNQLTELDVSKNSNLTILVCSGNQLSALDVSQNVALNELRCNSNQLSALDVSKNTALKSLWCHANKLTVLDVSQNTKLEELNCSENQLTALDVSKNTELKGMNCGENQLMILDVSANTSLMYLYCYINQLEALDVSMNTILTKLYCYGNQLTELDVSMCTPMVELLCDNNKLASLKVSKDMKLRDLRIHRNWIIGDAMDMLVKSLPATKNGKMPVIYHKGERNVMTTAQVKAAKNKGWTPCYSDGNNWQEYSGSKE